MGDIVYSIRQFRVEFLMFLTYSFGTMIESLKETFEVYHEKVSFIYRSYFPLFLN